MFWTKSRYHFCRMGLHSSCCRRICIPQNAFDKYRNEKLHKDCQTPRHYLWLRKFLRCSLGEIWKDTVRKYRSFLDYTLCILFLRYLPQALLVQWVLSWVELSLAMPVLVFMVFMGSCDGYHMHSTLIQYFSASRLTGFTSLTPNEMCLEDVLEPTNIGKLKIVLK